MKRKPKIKFQTQKNEDHLAWYVNDPEFECDCHPSKGDWHWDVDRERWVCTSCERSQ